MWRSTIRGGVDRCQYTDRVRTWAPGVRAAPRATAAGRVLLSVITASELLHGVHRAIQPAVRTKRAAFVEAILERFPLLPVDLVTARTHAQVWAELAAAGQMIGPHDLWLAATCIAHGLTMVTANVREFARVPGLAVEVWGSPR